MDVSHVVTSRRILYVTLPCGCMWPLSDLYIEIATHLKRNELFKCRMHDQVIKFVNKDNATALLLHNFINTPVGRFFNTLFDLI